MIYHFAESPGAGGPPGVTLSDGYLGASAEGIFMGPEGG